MRPVNRATGNHLSLVHARWNRAEHIDLPYLTTLNRGCLPVYRIDGQLQVGSGWQQTACLRLSCP